MNTLKIGNPENWKIKKTPGYAYRVFNEQHRKSGIWAAKTFKSKRECKESFYSAIQIQPTGCTPALIGTRAGKEYQCDWVQKNTLVAGQTRSGKTCFLQDVLISLMHFGHHDYLKIVVLDTKAAAFRDLKKVATVVDTHEGVAATLASLVKLLRFRIQKTKLVNSPHDAKTANELAFRLQKKELAMPFVMVVFDEFADFMQRCKEEGDESSKNNIQTLASLGLGLGINLTFSTQAPYKEYITGVIKNNFERRISFSLGDFYQEQLILGKQKKGREESAPSLNCGEFYLREMGERVKYTSVHAGEFCMKNAANNLRHWGFDFRLKI